MRSLRARLAIVTAVVALVAVGVNALLSRQVVTTELRRVEHLDGPVSLEGPARALAALRAAGGGPRAADSLLAHHGRRLRRGLVLVGRDGRALAASHAPLRDVHVTAGPGESYRFESGAGGARTALLMELRSPPRAALAGADSGAVLFALPPPAGAADRGPVLRTIERGLLVAVAAAIAAGTLMVWLLSRRLLGPIEALTAAARRVAAGDLSPRVTPRGHDEVAALGASFNAMADALEAARAARRRLTRDVAHELRTPLTALRGQVEALQDGLLPADAATLRSLNEEVARLMRLIEDLERVAEAEDGTLRLDLAAVPARAALEEAAASFAAAAAAAGVTLAVRADADVVVRADALRLGQILRNLVANALAHTPPGGSVELAARREGERVALAVADTGAGIAPEHLPHVFERFYRTDAARSRAGGGSGLGLAIVKHLAEAQGGAVRAEGAPGRGATFVVTLPAAVASRG